MLALQVMVLTISPTAFFIGIYNTWCQPGSRTGYHFFYCVISHGKLQYLVILALQFIVLTFSPVAIFIALKIFHHTLHCCPSDYESFLGSYGSHVVGEREGVGVTHYIDR